MGQRPKATAAMASKWSHNNGDNKYDADDKGMMEATAFAPRQHPVARCPPLILSPMEWPSPTPPQSCGDEANWSINKQQKRGK